MGGRLYERMGMALGGYYFIPIPNLCNGGSFQLYTYSLRCFQDDSVTVNQITDCQAWNWLTVDETNLNKHFKIYPNPNASGFLNAESLSGFV